MNGEGAVTIAHLSDIHIGADRGDAVARLPQDVAAARPDVVVVTGDLTMRARSAEFAAARDMLTQLPQPTMVVLGNHDVPLFAVHERFLAPYSRYEKYMGRGEGLDPVVEVPGARLLGLQSMPRWRWKSGRVSQRQKELVAEVLGTAPAGMLRVLAMHHPPSLGGLATLARAGGLRRALAGSRVDLVLAGHTHIPRVLLLPVGETEAEDGPRVVEVVCGTSGSTRTRGAPPAWLLLRCDRTSIAVTTRFYRPDSGWQAGPQQVHPRPVW